jgi:hypothetical protein
MAKEVAPGSAVKGYQKKRKTPTSFEIGVHRVVSGER